MNKRVQFPPDKLDYLEEVALTRKENRRHSHTPHGKSDASGELASVMAEAAFGLAQGWTWSQIAAELARQDPTDGWQFVLHNGKKVKVQGSTSAGHLIIKQGHLGADVYVLAQVDIAQRLVDFKGWAPTHVVASAEIRQGQTPSHWLPAIKLRAIERL